MDRELTMLVQAAQGGDLTAYGLLIARTQTMVYAVARRILREPDDARDAAQNAYLRAFRGLARLGDPAAFPGYLRRTAIRAAHDVHRARRSTLAPIEQALAVPVLDEGEDRWSPAQRAGLGRALLCLPRAERRLADRYYHGGWSVARLAVEANVTEPAMRKRLQRMRDKLREEIEMTERNLIAGEVLPQNLPDRVVELLSRPALVDLPENPVGHLVAALRATFSDYAWTETDEVVDLTIARSKLDRDPVYVRPDSVFHLDADRILRYDLTLPLVLSALGKGLPLSLMTAGKVYRNERESRTHLSAFHQLELLTLIEHGGLSVWAFIGRVLEALDRLLPGLPQRVERTTYPFCERSWDIGVERDGQYFELIGCGVYTPDVVLLLGGDPARHQAIGLGLGLERLASLHFGIPDIRELEQARV